MHKRITIQEAENLLNKYYEGFTSTEEEKVLYTFLSQKHLPEKFEADKALLGYFASHKKKRKTLIIPFRYWRSMAASVIIALTIVPFLLPGKPHSYAYIDGEKTTDIERIKQQALASIHSWNNSDNDTNLDTDELIIQQLQLFVK
jgi:hypothetical protein